MGGAADEAEASAVPAGLAEAAETARDQAPPASEPEAEREVGPPAEAAPVGEASPPEPASESAEPPPVGPPAAEPDDSPPARAQSEAGAATGVYPVEHMRSEDPAAASVVPASLAPLATEVVTADSAGPEIASRLPGPMADERLPLPPVPDSAPSGPPGVHEGAAAPVAPETPPAGSQPPRQAAQLPSDDDIDTALSAIESPAEATQLRRGERPLPEPLELAAGTSGDPAQTSPLSASVPATAWTPPVVQDAPEPGPAAQVRPASQPQRDAAWWPPDLRRTLPWLRVALGGTALVAAGLVVTVLALVVLYRWVNPPVSALMIGRTLAGTEIERTWRPLERISPHLMRAVILSEDGGFCRHRGVDWAAIEEAIEADRGGSTITMQLVKNLFLWPSRSYVRKAIEIGLAYLVEALWSKQRILEIYLNIVEWGDGVFGAEAAAQTHFGKRAARLTAEEAALLAVVLPNPIERTAGSPSFMTGRLAARLLRRMRTSRADLSCVPVLRVEPRQAPQKSPQKSPKAPLVQGPRMTL